MDSLFLTFSSYLLLLFFSSFFSGSETALFSTSEVDLKLYKKEKAGAFALIIKMLEKPKELLVIILAGNLFVNILLSTLSNNLSIKVFGNYGPVATIIILTPILLFFGEVIPKNLAINNSKIFSKWVIKPIYIFGIILSPIRYILVSITNSFFKIFGIDEKRHSYSLEELKSSIKISQKQGVLKASESKYILNIMKMESREAQHVMVPRNETIFIEYGATIAGARSVFNKYQISILPVFRNNIDNIVGFIFLKDIVSFKFGLRKARNINRLIREASFFPYSKELIELLKDFRSAGIRVAVILDEFGGTAGIVTLKDIISSIMGFNPTQDPQEKIQRINKSTYKVFGDILLDDFNDIFKTNFDSEQIETLNGFLIEKLGKIPKIGDSLILNGIRFTIIELNENRIEKILLKQLE